MKTSLTGSGADLALVELLARREASRTAGVLVVEATSVLAAEGALIVPVLPILAATLHLE